MTIKSTNLSLRLYFKGQEMPDRQPCKWDGEKFDTFIRFLVGVYGWEVTINYESTHFFDGIHVDRTVKVYTDMDEETASAMYKRAVAINF